MRIPFFTKKATKKNLDELREIMPVLSENEQRGYIGAARYYNFEGAFLGTYGSGQEMRVIDNDQLSTVRANPNQLHGIALSAASDCTIRAVLQKNYIPSEWGDFEWRSSGVFAGFTLEGVFVIGRGNWKDHHGNLRNVMAHEASHFNSGNFTGCPHEEVRALMAQINHSSYNYTTDWFRREVGHNLYIFRNKTGNPISFSEAMTIARAFE